MVKNKTGGNKSKRMARKRVNAPVETKLRLAVNDGEMYACVTKLYGHGMVDIKGTDNRDRLCIIRKKFRGRSKRDNTLTIGRIVLIGLREWEVLAEGKKEKCDLLEVYNDVDTERLKLTPTVNISSLLNTTDTTKAADSFDYVDNDTFEYYQMQENNNTETLKITSTTGATVCDDIIEFDDI